ncbi:MAG: GIY-YIG nuclease family protein, partial [Candidatus Marinimicrobia bacterium]|nr:GIY-YIG nuclease family protein [Candidatus Neomarinimicrobiota bacterium]
MEKLYYVYIMASESKVIYTGMTNNLFRRVYEHKMKLFKGFSKKYNTYKLVWYDETDDVTAAIEFEKQIK